MREKILFCLLCFAVSSILTVGFLNTSFAEPAVQPKIYVFSPDTQTNIASASPNETFTIEIRIADVTQLFTWEFYLNWSTTQLELVVDEISEGPFLSSSGAYETFLIQKYPGFLGWNYQNTLGMSATLKGVGRDACPSGGGVLATVTFRVKAAGASTLDLWHTIVEDYDTALDRLKDVAHTVDDGYFRYPLSRVSVEPEQINNPNLRANQNFSINITILGVENLYNWSLTLKWVPAILDETSIVEGPFLSGAAQDGTAFGVLEINQAEGSLHVGNTLKGRPLGGVNGSGNLATVTFAVEAVGESFLNINDVELFKSDGTIIPHDPLYGNGYFSNLKRDVTVTSVEVSSNTVVKGQSLNVTVVVENLGDVTESFDVTIRYGDNPIGTVSVPNLASGDSRTLIIKWDTKDVVPGSYTLSAVASLPADMDVDNNSRSASGSISVTEESVIPINLVIGAIVAIGVVGVVVMFWYKRAR